MTEGTLETFGNPEFIETFDIGDLLNLRSARFFDEASKLFDTEMETDGVRIYDSILKLCGEGLKNLDSGFNIKIAIHEQHNK